MYGLKRGDLFIKSYKSDIPTPVWNTFEESHGNIYLASKEDATIRLHKLEKFYRHIPIELHEFTERELEEIVILKLKS